MPYCFPLKSLSTLRIQRCIPNKWKLRIIGDKIRPERDDLSGEEAKVVEALTKIRDKLMIQQLHISLKEFISRGNLGEACGFFRLIQLHVSSADFSELILDSVSCFLKACVDLRTLQLGLQLHGKVISLGFDGCPLLVPKLVTLYSTFDLLSDARFVAENSRVLHPLPWNVVISAYVRNRRCRDALEIYEQMLGLGIRPDEFTYPSVLKASGETVDLEFGRKVHRSIMASKYAQCLYVQNALIAMYGKCGDITTAHRVFKGLLERDEVSWNTMISVFALNGMLNEACEFMEKMHDEGLELNIIAWNTLAGGYLHVLNFKVALDLLSRMRIRAIHLDDVSVLIALSSCSQIGAIKLGREIHGSAIRCGAYEFHNVKNALITMYSKCEDLKHAYLVFHLMKDKSIVSWNSVISGYASWDKSEAYFLFRELFLSKFQPNFVTIASILPLCARTVNLQSGKEIHGFITRREVFKDHLLLWNSLVEMYARSGKIVCAKRLFDRMSIKNEVTYTSLIVGYGIQGYGEVASKLFDHMIDFGIKPDHVTMVAILSACSRSGLVTRGRQLFDNMSSLYGIDPCVEHFTCMVDLYGRAGLFEEAEDFLSKIPCDQQTPAMWITLIGACRIHKNMELGVRAAKKLLDMRPRKCGYYVLIANMYAAAECWNQLAHIRKCMKDLGVRKDFGSAWLDLRYGFRLLSADDASLRLDDEIYTP